MDSRKGSGLGYDRPKTHDLSQGTKVPMTGLHRTKKTVRKTIRKYRTKTRTKNRTKNRTKIPFFKHFFHTFFDIELPPGSGASEPPSPL